MGKLIFAEGVIIPSRNLDIESILTKLDLLSKNYSMGRLILARKALAVSSFLFLVIFIVSCLLTTKSLLLFLMMA